MWFRTQNIPKAAKIDESEESATEDSVLATEVAKSACRKRTKIRTTPSKPSDFQRVRLLSMVST